MLESQRGLGFFRYLIVYVRESSEFVTNRNFRGREESDYYRHPCNGWQSVEEGLSETVWESNVCQTLLTTNNIGLTSLSYSRSAVISDIGLIGRPVYDNIPFHGLEGWLAKKLTGPAKFLKNKTTFTQRKNRSKPESTFCCSKIVTNRDSKRLAVIGM